MRKAWVVLLLTLVVCTPALGEEPAASPLDGTWKATFADTLFSGTVYLTLEVQADGIVSGTYKATTGGFGTVTGRLDKQAFSFTLTQSKAHFSSPEYWKARTLIEFEKFL